MRKLNFIAGQQFGKWTIISLAQSPDYDKPHSYYDCKCDCGRVLKIRASVLNCKRASRGCIFCKTRKGKGVSAFNRVYRNYKRQAIQRSLEWDLTEDQFREITSSNCYYTGLPPSSVMKVSGGNGEYVYNGIDRLDNSKGYNINNCVACIGEINRMKSNLSYSQFVELCSLVSMRKENISTIKLKVV